MTACSPPPPAERQVAAMQTLERLAFVEAKTPLRFDEVDFTINEPEFLIERLAAPLEYAQRVEALVGHTNMGDLMPRRDERIDRFLTTWTSDELEHARVLDELMRLVDLEPVDLATFEPPTHNRWIAFLGRASQSLHDCVSVIWATSGAMNEHLAMSAYSRIDNLMQERGEVALHTTLFRRLRAHESAHKSFYVAYAHEIWQTLQPWQKRLARYSITKTWAPVGATAPDDKPAFARAVLALSDDEWRDEIVDPLQAIAERILDLDGEPMDAFVERAVLECFEASQLADDAARVRRAA